MKHLAIVDWTEDKRLSKYQDYPTASEAEAHVKRVKKQWPKAFAAPSPGGDMRDWAIDPANKTVTIVPASQATEREPSEIDILRRAIQNQGGPIITDADMDAARTALTSAE